MEDDIARLGFDIDSAPAGSAAKELLKLDAAAAAVAASTAKMEAAGRRSDGRFRSMSKFARENADSVRRLASEFNSGMAAQLNYASAVERLTEAIRLGVVADNEKEAAMERLKAQYLGNASAVEALRQKYIPLYAASQQLEQSQREIEQAMKQGWLTAAQGEAALERLNAEYITTATGANTYANSMRRVNNIQSSVGNQFAQLNDVVVTSWGGMSPALVGMQQGMQMVQGYAGQSLPQALATLRGSFAQLLNPTTLLVVGVTAGAAALIQWGMAALGSAGDTKALKNAMDSLEESTSELQRYTDLLNKSYAELRGEFGENAHQARELFKVMSMLSQLEAMDRMVEVTEAVSDNFEDMAQRIERINFAKLENAERVVARQQRLLNEEMGVTEDQARSLLSAQNAVNDAITSTEKLSAMRGLFDAIVAVRDETGKVPDALRPLAIEIGRAIERMQILETKSSDAEDATRSIFEVAVSGDWLDPAIKQAGVLANMLYTAVLWKNALFNRNQTDAAGNETQFGEGSRARSAPPSAPNNIDAGLPPVASGGGGSGGGNRRERELERFIESLQTERETLEAWRVEQMDLLAQFNEAELEAIGGHNEAKLRLEQEYQDKLDAIKNQERSVRLGEMSSMFAGLAAVAEQGGKKMLKVQATLSAAATMIAAYETASKAAAEATTIPGRIAAWAFFVAQGLSAVKSIQSIGSSGSVSGSTGSGAPSGASAAAAPEPERVVRINVQGERWMRDLVEGLASQLYEASEDGARVVIAR